LICEPSVNTLTSNAYNQNNSRETENDSTMNANQYYKGAHSFGFL